MLIGVLDVDFRQLRYFVAIYEHGTLTAAAEQLRVAASALSHHLTNLETELSATLFRRKPRGIEPTAAGARLYDHARTILRGVADAEQDVREAGGQISGNVSIGMAYSAVKAIGVPLLECVMTDYPLLRLSLSESLSGSTLLHVLSSEVDLALVYNPPPDPRLRTTPVIEERMVCVGRKEIIGDEDAPIRFSDLLELPVIILRQGLSARALIDDATLLKRLEAKAQLEMNSVYAIAGSLLAGLGCVVGTRLFMSEHLESGALHARPIIEPGLTRTLYLCELSDRPSTFARETVSKLALALIADAVEKGVWDARLIARSHGANAAR